MPIQPLSRAALAIAYILLIVFGISHTEGFDAQAYGLIAPMTFLMVLVFSAALMGYIFFYEPVRLLAENKSAEARKDFFATIRSFLLIGIGILFVFFLLHWVIVGAINQS